MKRASARWIPSVNPLFVDDDDLGDHKMITKTKLGRLKSAMPGKEANFEDTDSDVSDPEIKRLKRKASICCKFMIESLLILGIL